MPGLQSFLLKSLAQNLICLLPRPIGDTVHYFAQRRFGSLRDPDPMPQVRRAAALLELASSVRPVTGGRVLEGGTGPQLTLPIILLLFGAAASGTVDVHRYLRKCRVAGD